ncbi:MAG: hypothetical protein GQ533_00110 [Methanosarcinaceae archaeon]|jgi:hypothetical protein|nr:hypothetical protein [Methanosarcinaceae archaeon]
MEKGYTEGTILKLITGTVDRERVYDQNIVFKLQNCMNLELFDYNMLITPDMICHKNKIKIKMLDSNFPEKYRRKKNPMQEKRITYNEGYDIYGEVIDKTVVKINESTRQEDCKVDFGMGHMILTTEVGEFVIGDFIYVHASRLDVVGVINIPLLKTP